MSDLIIKESTLSSIGDAIRSKTGGTELIAPLDMPTEIEGIETGGMELPEEAFVISGNCNYRFAYDGWTWFINEFGDRITTKDISNGSYMFRSSYNITDIPFTLNFNNSEGLILNYCLAFCSNLTKPPLLNIPNARKINISNLFNGCNSIRDLNGIILNEEDFIEFFQSYKVTSAYNSHQTSGILTEMYSLREVPSWWYGLRLNPESTVYPSYGYTIYYTAFNYCYVLDEIKNIPVWVCQGAQTSNMFYSTFSRCERVKDITFETNPDGTPITTSWKTQTIDLTSFVGHTSDNLHAINYNSGITKDKEVKDDTTYQALKNDPDWFPTKIDYSRYNHDSAVNTINSLPDTSAYLATAGGTNTIKFRGAYGALTDGGAINTLTEEEIAVAAAKGWTVALS